ncbi:hypothetical protein FIBSPDRAFT_136906 [Athelia psychrophila]|uniref:Uncharacterized protein n=1 Tax=Athelia psychrophila TaxID=1759441 RepID=A0A166C4F9_9AGAM|nr:hypothetical protein FIBSPDRAFT_136906 [Fibularhizoctonia sp. CBS 109695]
MTCDLCGTAVNLGKRGNSNPIMEHRESEKCKRITFGTIKEAAKKRNLAGEDTMHSITWPVIIQLVILPQRSLGSFLSRILLPKRRNWLWVSQSKLHWDGEGLTIFLTVMGLRLD